MGLLIRNFFVIDKPSHFDLSIVSTTVAHFTSIADFAIIITKIVIAISYL